MGRRLGRFAGCLLVAVGAASCAGINAASQVAKAPELQPQGQTKCDIVKSQDHPLVIEWPSSDRLQLKTKARQNLVPVRYVGCEMTVLERWCGAPGSCAGVATDGRQLLFRGAF
jgi:hypothetical protein